MESDNVAQGKNPEFSNSANKTVERFAKEMVECLKNVKASDWKQGWSTGKVAQYALPKNVEGRNYSGTNSMFLSFDTVSHGYKMPIYLSFAQCMKEGVEIKKGQKAVPVIFWCPKITGTRGKKYTVSEWNKLPDDKKKKCTVNSRYRTFYLYNVDQTNMYTKNYERYQELLATFPKPTFSDDKSLLRDTNGMYTCPALDRMIEHQDWICRIQATKVVDGAFYSPSRDLVVCPRKEQFNIGKNPEEVYKNGMEYYSSLLHEMTHSTGTANRLNREKGAKFGDAKYAKEEMVAELTAALVGYSLGFDGMTLKNNAMYIDGWINAMRQEPKFILSVMADVSKASRLILEKIDEQKIALGEKPVLSESMDKVKSEDISQASVMNRQQPIALNAHFDFLGLKERGPDNYALTAVYDHKELGTKRIKTVDAVRYNAMFDGIEKDEFLMSVASLTFAPEIDYLRQMQLDPINVNTAVVNKNNDGTYSVRVTVDDKSLGTKKISNRDGYNYMLLNPSLKKDVLLRDIVKKAYGDELKEIVSKEQRQSKGLKL